MEIEDAIDACLATARAQPDRVAIQLAGRAISYGAFADRVRAFAAQFHGRGPGVLIALAQGPDAYAAMLGAGLAGCYYTPVNLEVPAEKLRRVVGLLQPQIIVAEPEIYAALAPAAPGAARLGPAEVDASDLRFEGRGARHAIAYILFTSGSTGLPKGVVIGRAALNHYVDWVRASGTILPDDRVSQFPNLAFDISITDLFGSLAVGATIFPVIGMGDRMLPARMIAREKITMWNSTPSVISLMIRAGQVTPANFASLRLLNLCGEPLLPVQLAAIFAAAPDAVVQNAYGPTEATVTVTEIRLTRDNFAGLCMTSATIGPAIARMGIHLIGGAHADEGEIVITGPQLADGYWQDEAKTAAAFRTIEIDGVARRAYFTGDWAERRGGNIFFKERIDLQVKINGFRLELDEVAQAIHECGYPVTCVLKWRDQLACVIEPIPGRAFDEPALRAALLEKLEKHAVPALIRLIGEIPRNQNDKLDRAAVAQWLDATEPSP